MKFFASKLFHWDVYVFVYQVSSFRSETDAGALSAQWKSCRHNSDGCRRKGRPFALVYIWFNQNLWSANVRSPPSTPQQNTQLFTYKQIVIVSTHLLPAVNFSCSLHSGMRILHVEWTTSWWSHPTRCHRSMHSSGHFTVLTFIQLIQCSQKRPILKSILAFPFKSGKILRAFVLHKQPLIFFLQKLWRVYIE